jgi:hypothetical protein
MVTDADFRIQFGFAAETFQLLEETLKMYLVLCFEIVRNRLPSAIRFDYSDKDVVNQPLGRLARMFAKYNGETSLYKEIIALTEKRNYIAHQAYLTLLTGARDPETMVKEITKVHGIQQEASAVVRQVMQEMTKLRKFSKRKVKRSARNAEAKITAR